MAESLNVLEELKERGKHLKHLDNILSTGLVCYADTCDSSRGNMLSHKNCGL